MSKITFERGGIERKVKETFEKNEWDDCVKNERKRMLGGIIGAILVVVLLLSFTSCGFDKSNTLFGFTNSGKPSLKFSWFCTIIFLIVTFLPVLISLFLIKSNSEDWKGFKWFCFIYGGLATLIIVVSKWGFSWSGDGITWMLLTAIVAVVFGFFAGKISKKKHAVETKCPKCGQLSALQEVDRVCTGSHATTISRLVETKDRQGNVIASTRVPVPATRYFYDVHLTCKFCSHNEVWKTNAVYEN